MSLSNRQVSRRSFSKLVMRGLVIPGVLLARSSMAQNIARSGEPDGNASPESWIASWKDDRVKRLLGPLDLRRFSDPIYILLKPIGWQDHSTNPVLPDVAVPEGFVTDFASVPRPFWSLFRPDGNYAYAAVLHDYLYWEQPVNRSVADDIFRSAMNDLKVTDRQANLLHTAVEQFGQSAWNQNAKLRRQGERRVLKKFPDNPAITWQEWKSTPGVFDRS